MPPMATSSGKRKWSDVFDEGEVYDKQSLMDLCTSKLRYVNPARPPRRRTEVPLLRNVLIVNTMRHLSTDIKVEKPMDYNTEELSVDPGHFEGLPPLSELLTDIMLDPQPCDQQQWTASPDPAYSNLTPLEPSIPSYLGTPDMDMEGGENDKIVHDLLPCTSVIGLEPGQQIPWDSQASQASWHANTHSSLHSQSWTTSENATVLDCFLPSASTGRTVPNSTEVVASESSFQSSNGPLPSFTSVFESAQSSFTELLQAPSESANHSSSSYFPFSSSFPSMHGASTDDLVGNVNLSDSELELLAMTFSSKLPPNMSFEDLVHACSPQASLHQTSQPSQTFFVPSTQSSSIVSSCEQQSSVSGQCASYCRKDQPQTSVDDGSMVRVLVNL